MFEHTNLEEEVLKKFLELFLLLLNNLWSYRKLKRMNHDDFNMISTYTQLVGFLFWKKVLCSNWFLIFYYYYRRGRVQTVKNVIIYVHHLCYLCSSAPIKPHKASVQQWLLMKLNRLRFVQRVINRSEIDICSKWPIVNGIAYA